MNDSQHHLAKAFAKSYQGVCHPRREALKRIALASVGGGLVAVATFLLSGALPARAQELSPRVLPRPNILWVIVENIGPDLGCYGQPLVKTPHIDQFAAEGIRYRLAFSTAPMCSPSRSAFMTGMYQTAIGAHNHRGHRTPGVDDHFHLPPDVQPITHRLRAAGYVTANIVTLAGKRVGTGKTDLNFEVEGPVLCPEEPPASAKTESVLHNFQNSVRLFEATEWSELKSHQPFFAQVNLPVVERSSKGWISSQEAPWSGQSHPKRIDPAQVTLPPYYPDQSITREDWAGYLDAVCGVDDRVGEILKRLGDDGLADDTVVILFADNGRLEHRGHGWCYDSGDRVPLVIRWPQAFAASAPNQYRAGSVSDRLVSLLDLTATTLAIAGIKKPLGMHSQVFLGPDAEPPRAFVFSARDRHDEAVQRVRAVRTARYRYIRNFMPQRPLMAMHRYKDACYSVVPLLRQLYKEGKLDAIQKALMAPRLPDEELYDLDSDPYEIKNLATSPDPEHQHVLKQLRAELERWIEETKDQGRYAEPRAMIDYWTRQMHERFGTPELEPPYR